MEYPIQAVDDGYQMPDIECPNLDIETLARLESNDPELTGLSLFQDGWIEGAGRAIGGNKHLKKLSISIVILATRLRMVVGLVNYVERGYHGISPLNRYRCIL
jgi:hypothetical protein